MIKSISFLKGSIYLCSLFFCCAILLHNNAYAEDYYFQGNDGYQEEYVVAIPKGNVLEYNGKIQYGVSSGTGYYVANGSDWRVGEYKATVRLYNGYVWSDGTYEDKEIKWKIVKAYTVKVPVGSTLEYNGSIQYGFEKDSRFSVIAGDERATKVGDYTTTLRLNDNGYGWSDGTTEDKNVKWRIVRAYVVEIPEGKVFEYNGRSQCLFNREHYSLYLGDSCATNVGKYKAILELNDDGYGWFDGTTDKKTVTWNITVGNTPIEAVLGKEVIVPFADIKRSGRNGYIIPLRNVLEVRLNYYTKLTYTKTGKVRRIAGKDRKCNKKIRVNNGNEQIILKRKLQKGTYILKVRVQANRTVNTRQQFKVAEVTINVQ